MATETLTTTTTVVTKVGERIVFPYASQRLTDGFTSTGSVLRANGVALPIVFSVSFERFGAVVVPGAGCEIPAGTLSLTVEDTNSSLENVLGSVQYDVGNLMYSAAMIEAVTAFGLPAADPAAETLIGRMTVEPDTLRKIIIRGTYARLKATSGWAKLDALWVLPAHDEQAGRRNWVQDAFNLTLVGTPAFTKDKGFRSDGSNFLNSQFNPATATTPKFTQNAAAIGIWSLTESNQNLDDMGNTGALIRNYTSGALALRCNSGTTSTTPDLPYNARTSVGLTWVSRQASTGYSYGRNATTLGTITNTSVAPTSDTILVGGGRVAGNGAEQIAIAFIGSVTPSEIAELYNALLPYMEAVVGPDLSTVDPSIEYQTLDGVGMELQSDSIEGDSGGIQETNTSSFPLDLTPSERLRFATTIAASSDIVTGQRNAFHDFRMAMGLYYRGVTQDGKNIRERLTGQNAAIRDFIANSGIQGINFLYWSPAPYWKKVTISGTTYRGSIETIPNKGSDPTGWNTYLRRMLQGGTLDHPDKVSDPTGYAAWMNAFTDAIISDMEYVHQNIGRIVKFTPQNEPNVGALTSAYGYPACIYSDEQMYDVMKAVVPKIRASAILSSYNGQSNRITIYMEAGAGQTGRGAVLAKADAALLAEIDGWSWHAIDGFALNAAYARLNKATFTTGALGRPVWFDENEYFDSYVDSGGANYRPSDWRFINLLMMAMYSFTEINSPIWYPIHIIKPSNGPENETKGRALAVGRSPGTATNTLFPSLQEGYFDTYGPNWHALKPWLKFMPKGSKRVKFEQTYIRNDCLTMAWRRPDGKLVLAFANRRGVQHTFRVPGGALQGKTFAGYRYDQTTADQSLGTVPIWNYQDFKVPASSAEFWVEA